jgi:heat-inducible transcriptional repressor
VDEYIKSATPISSAEIKEKHFEDISSATIRAELSTLEELGYLQKMHTSSGRVPSSLAYKTYAESFASDAVLDRTEIEKIQSYFSERLVKVEEIVERTAKVISDITNYTSVIVVNNIGKVTIKKISLVDIDEHTALVIIVTDSGIIRDKSITLSKKISRSFLDSANTLINNIFAGKTLAEMKSTLKIVAAEMNEFRELYETLITILENYSQGDAEVYLEGASKTLGYAETDADAAKNFLQVIDSKKNFARMLEDDRDIEFSVKIGKEEGGIEKCALIAAKYTINGKDVGHAGVIGPERMDYNKVMAVLKYISKSIDVIAGNKSGK